MSCASLNLCACVYATAAAKLTSTGREISSVWISWIRDCIVSCTRWVTPLAASFHMIAKIRSAFCNSTCASARALLHVVHVDIGASRRHPPPYPPALGAPAPARSHHRLRYCPDQRFSAALTVASLLPRPLPLSSGQLSQLNLLTVRMSVQRMRADQLVQNTNGRPQPDALDKHSR